MASGGILKSTHLKSACCEWALINDDYVQNYVKWTLNGRTILKRHQLRILPLECYRAEIYR